MNSVGLLVLRLSLAAVSIAHGAHILFGTFGGPGSGVGAGGLTQTAAQFAAMSLPGGCKSTSIASTSVTYFLRLNPHFPSDNLPSLLEIASCIRARKYAVRAAGFVAFPSTRMGRRIRRALDIRRVAIGAMACSARYRSSHAGIDAN